MRTLASLTLLGLLVAQAPARAEFNMITPDTTTPPAGAPKSFEPAPAETSSPAARAPDSHLPAQTTSRAAEPTHKNSTALGFGENVPLSFAVRQIVPASIKVTYGRGADQSALVNWQGGRRWTTVLRAAVRPLGLHVSLHKSTLAISQ